MNNDLRSKLDRIQRTALVVGALGLLLVAWGFVSDRGQFYRSYLFAFTCVAMFGLGSLALTMIHYLTGGFWGLAIRRQLEAGIRTLPLVGLMFVPVALAIVTQPEPGAAAAHGEHGLAGNYWLYPWTDHALVASDHLLHHKEPWLNVNGFLGRTILYFVIWLAMGFGILRAARKFDETGDPAAEKRAKYISGPGVLIFALTITGAAFDWMMSLDPKWYSTMYGVIYMVGCGLAAMAFSVVFTSWVKDHEPYPAFAKGPLFHDLGTLMFAMTMLWAYTSFSQGLIIWSGNIAEETPWYLVRAETSWQIVLIALAVLHFALPFFLLLMRRIKRDASFVVPVALLLLVMRHVDMYWQVVPVFHPTALAPHWMDFAAPVGLGGLWLAFFLNRFKAHPVTSPRHDTAVQAALGHAHH
ncbi:MAG: hypothetical protein JNK02_07780 [Planctomycetes bacterium]|nr:hypothetical protein [Planctomycetota bacterium]